MRVVGWVRIIIQATVWKLTRDLNWRSTSQSHQIVLLQLYHLSQLPVLPLLFMTAPDSFQKLQATVLKLMQNFSRRMVIQLRNLPWSGTQILGILWVPLKGTVHSDYASGYFLRNRNTVISFFI